MGDPYVRAHAVNIYVRDQERSLRFYVDQLGFQVAVDARLQHGARWVAVAPPDGGTMLALIVPREESFAVNLIGRPTGIVFATESLLHTYAEWRKRGVHFNYAPRLRRVKYGKQGADPADEQIQPWGGVFAHFRDLDGNTFGLVEFDEETKAIEAQRRAAAEKQEAERLAAHEIAIAKQVQARLFPQTRPPIRTLEYAGLCIQARQVGGDYYDFLDLGGGRFGFLAGDIAGKGIAASLLMANLQASIRIHCAAASDARPMLCSVNRVFHQNSIETAYATLFFGEYDDETRRLRYANCGHLPPLVLRADGCVEKLASTGTVVGLFTDWDCTVEERTLAPGDLLALYTDGITEAFNAADEDFGEARLIDALRRNRHLAPEQIVGSIVDEVQEFSDHRQSDDITLIVARARSI